MKTKTSEEKAHSEFGGSQAERIMNCPASVVLSRGIPRTTNAASERGTHAHACLEFLLNNRKLLRLPKSRVRVLDEADQNLNWDQDMVDHGLDAVSFIEKRMQPGATLYVEQKLDSSKFTTKDQGSTLDVAIANWTARDLVIIDYKYGKHPVKVIRNAQLIYYGLAMLIKLKGWSKFDRLTLIIIQPNAYLEPQESVISVASAINWGRKFKAAVKLALGPKPPYKYGDKWCFFCPAKKKCPVMRQRQQAKDFD